MSQTEHAGSGRAAADRPERQVRPLRADARRNRDKLLAVARESFAAEGLSVSLDEIARRAAVSGGTLHRHFPTKEMLCEEIIATHVESLITVADELAAAADPGKAFFTFCSGMIERSTPNRALSEVLGGLGTSGQARIADLARRFDAAFDVLIERAQAAGEVRADVSVEDVRALLNGIHLLAESGGGGRDGRPGQGARALRLLAVIHDGLRTRPAAG